MFIFALPTFTFAATVTSTIIDTNANKLENAVLALYSIHGSNSSPPNIQAEMLQKDLQFVPQVLAIQRGTTVRFPNKDNTQHHVYSFSKAKKFEIKLYSSAEQPRTILFDQPGVVSLGCNIHDWMLGYIYVVDTPYFALSNSQGIAKIANVPHGNYKAKIWHPNSRRRNKPVVQKLVVNKESLTPSFKISIRAKRKSNDSVFPSNESY